MKEEEGGGGTTPKYASSNYRTPLFVRKVINVHKINTLESKLMNLLASLPSPTVKACKGRKAMGAM
jgi:hypothetical protein